MYSDSHLALRILHSLISGKKSTFLTEKELVRRYTAEYIILEELNQPDIENFSRPCTGCHGKPGIAIRVYAPGDVKYSFIYIGSESEIAAGEYGLSIYHYKTQLSCKEIYYRKFGQAPETGWLETNEKRIGITNSLLASAGQHASWGMFKLTNNSTHLQLFRRGL